MSCLFNDNRVISQIITKNLRYLRHLWDKNYSHADLADYADCQLIYPCSSVSLRLTKTDIHPLKSMGRCPAAMLPLWLYKSKLLTPKRKPASTFLQKAYILFKAINRKSTFCWKNAVNKLCTPSKEMFIYCLQPCCCRYNEIVMR